MIPTTIVSRIGLAITKPRVAITMAGDRTQAGRAGSDLLLAILVLVFATQLRWLVSAVWLGAAVAPALGARAVAHVLTRSLTLELGLLVASAGVIFLASGAKRELGRAFDLACVAALPLVIVHLVAQTVVGIGELAVPPGMSWAIELASILWMAALTVLAIPIARGSDAAGSLDRRARRAGWSVATIALAGVVVQLLWIGQHVDQIRPLEAGGAAPAFSLASIGPGGQLGTRVARVPGRVTIVDFWATWCGPCVRSMPHLDAFARAHPEVDVLTINLDDAKEARALFDRQGYKLQLLADDGDASEKFGVTTIPHTAVIDAHGRLSRLTDGGPLDLEAAVRAVQ
ncbi:hypothetical protein BH11MYX1_BH11MYX1_34200 [soil metagenome]